MFGAIVQKAKLIAKDETLRKRILFVLGVLVLFRVLATIPIPGVDVQQLNNFFANNQFLGLLNIFSGGGLANLSIVMLGVGPYITASIIMQLLTMMSPKLKAMHQEEGDAGKKKFSQYSRILTLPLAFMQGFAFLTLLQSQGIVTQIGLFEMFVNVSMIAGGSILLMWLGELITEFGIGNGISLLIFAGIVASLPMTVTQLILTFDISQLPLFIGFIAAVIVVTAGVVVITEAERPIPVTYARRVRGMKAYGGISTYLPIRLNQAGVIPIIFALSIMLFPQMIFNFLQGMDITVIASISNMIPSFIKDSWAWIYAAIYFFLVFAFTYFYTAVTFDPDSISTNLQKSGAFIPGVRPGQTTAKYIGKILTRLTLVGATFLGAIAVLPLGMQAATGVTAFAIGGTALLIAVSVVLDLVRKVESQLSIREY